MITVLVNCAACPTVKEKVTVRSRYENEDIIAFVKEVGRRIYHDHRNRHPGCQSLLDAMIPTGEKGIGY